MTILSIISKHVKEALINNNITYIDNLLINRTSNKKMWDYQVNGIITIAKKLNKNPYILSQSIVHSIQKNNHKIYKQIEVSKLGFINVFINKKWIETEIETRIKSFRLGIKYIQPKKIIIDYSSPNIAKEMHVGHLRSTIIGDSIARIMEFLGHNVIRVNHIGDWGTHFGMIIAYIKINSLENTNMDQINFNKIYQYAKKKFDSDPIFNQKSRDYVVKLQNKNEECINIWKKIVNITISNNEKIYKRLNVTLNKKHITGESFYNEMLPNIAKDLIKKRIAIRKDGALIVFLNEFKNRHGKPMGVLIQKKDSAFLYSTIDLACLKYRYEVLHADQILYYTDARQRQYLIQILKIARSAGYIPKNLIIKHHTFGMICSEDKRPFKTRSGKNIKLSELLNEAIKRARLITKNKNNNLSEKELDYLSEKIGIGAIKYFDLSKNRSSNYIFNWEHILTFNGNTAPYIQYAYIRILSIFKKLNISMLKFSGNLYLIDKCEKKLAIKLLQFEEILLESSEKGSPHIICKYLYELATYFSCFYEKCSIRLSQDMNIKKSRLLLSLLTARTLKKGLSVIGVSTIKYM